MMVEVEECAVCFDAVLLKQVSRVSIVIPSGWSAVRDACPQAMRERATGRLCGQDVHLVGRDRHTVCICLIDADGWGLEDACSWDGWLWTVKGRDKRTDG